MAQAVTANLPAANSDANDLAPITFANDRRVVAVGVRITAAAKIFMAPTATEVAALRTAKTYAVLPEGAWEIPTVGTLDGNKIYLEAESGSAVTNGLSVWPIYGSER